jgi:hypothetical protein
MVEDHQKDIKKYTEEAGKGDGKASTYAKQVLPDLKKHLAMAQHIESGQTSSSMKGASSESTNRAPSESTSR